MIIIGKTSLSYNWKIDNCQKKLVFRGYTEKMHQICNTPDMGADVSETFKKCYDFFSIF